jgi:GNAT superfamily N-acetyltransferase
MIRAATHGDIPRIVEIRDTVGENPLSDPSRVTETDTVRFIDDGALWVWEENDGLVTGFSASDTHDGSIWALFVAAGHDGKGIGRALLRTACAALREAGRTSAVLTTEPGTRAERHYRADGWTVIGTSANGGLIFQKPL